MFSLAAREKAPELIMESCGYRCARPCSLPVSYACPRCSRSWRSGSFRIRVLRSPIWWRVPSLLRLRWRRYSPWWSRGTSKPAVLLQETGDRPDPQVIVLDFELFVGRVQTVVRQSESHEDGRNPEVIREVPDDRNGSAGANEHGLLTENLAECARGDVDRGMLGVDDQARRRAQHA